MGRDLTTVSPRVIARVVYKQVKISIPAPPIGTPSSSHTTGDANFQIPDQGTLISLSLSYHISERWIIMSTFYGVDLD